MRIAALGMHHETNTFQTVKTTYESFAKFEFFRGQEITKRHGTANSMLAGYYRAAAKYEFDLVPLLWAFTGPTGTITKDAFDRICGEMIDMLRKGMPWDGVLLAQHGAAVAEQYPDMDGEVARRVREVVGPKTPVVMTLDLHCNITQKQAQNTNAIICYRTNPHLDPVERSIEAGGILIQTIRGEVRPVQHLEQVPMVINIVKQPTAFGAMKEIMDDVAEVAKKQGVLSASCGQGFPYADVEQMGVSFVVVTDNNRKLAEEQAKWLARRAWDRRAELQNDSPSPAEAVRRAIAAPSGNRPTVIMDCGDNVGGGGSADSTHLLAEARKQRLEGTRSLLMSLYDPEGVQACIKAGVGCTVTLKVGGKTDDLHGKPVEVSGYVRAITDGKFEEPTPTHGGFRFYEYGPTVALDTTEGYTILLHSVRGVGNMSRQQYYSVGIYPEQYKTVICKGVVSPRAAYEPIAREIIMANTPGVTTPDLATFNYRHRRPLYPFDPAVKYPA